MLRHGDKEIFFTRTFIMTVDDIVNIEESIFGLPWKFAIEIPALSIGKSNTRNFFYEYSETDDTFHFRIEAMGNAQAASMKKPIPFAFAGDRLLSFNCFVFRVGNTINDATYVVTLELIDGGIKPSDPSKGDDNAAA